MILGFSHIGITVGDIEKSVKKYCDTFKTTVLNTGERKGPVADLVTGLQDFHSKTVYLSLSDSKHLELFEFLNPKPIFEEPFNRIRKGTIVGIVNKDLSGVRLKTDSELSGFEKLDNVSACPDVLMNETFVIDNENAPFLFFSSEKRESLPYCEEENLYVGIFVSHIDQSLEYYQTRLGLTILEYHDYSADLEFREDSLATLEKSVLLGVGDKPCIQLRQPVNKEMLPPKPWKMQRVGITHIAFGVSDIDRYYHELKNKKVAFNSPPQNLGVGPHQGGKVVYLNAPNGVVIELIESPLINQHFS
jgi:catechol 2,3-dioxygenase-like lactoylglutathione lyase family enzyme